MILLCKRNVYIKYGQFDYVAYIDELLLNKAAEEKYFIQSVNSSLCSSCNGHKSNHTEL